MRKWHKIEIEEITSNVFKAYFEEKKKKESRPEEGRADGKLSE